MFCVLLLTPCGCGDVIQLRAHLLWHTVSDEYNKLFQLLTVDCINWEFKLTVWDWPELFQMFAFLPHTFSKAMIQEIKFDQAACYVAIKVVQITFFGLEKKPAKPSQSRESFQKQKMLSKRNDCCNIGCVYVREFMLGGCCLSSGINGCVLALSPEN